MKQVAVLVGVYALAGALIPWPVEAQEKALFRVEPVPTGFHIDQEVNSPFQAEPLRSLDLQNPEQRPLAPYVIGGTVVGALAGGAVYLYEVRQMGDADFMFPISTAIYVLKGAGVGALTGVVIGALARGLSHDDGTPEH